MIMNTKQYHLTQFFISPMSFTIFQLNVFGFLTRNLDALVHSQYSHHFQPQRVLFRPKSSDNSLTNNF